MVVIQSLFVVALVVALLIIQEDSTLEKIGSFFGISHEDHTAELVKDVSIQVDSPPTAEVIKHSCMI